MRYSIEFLKRDRNIDKEIRIRKGLKYKTLLPTLFWEHADQMFILFLSISLEILKYYCVSVYQSLFRKSSTCIDLRSRESYVLYLFVCEQYYFTYISVVNNTHMIHICSRYTANSPSVFLAVPYNDVTMCFVYVH